LTGQVPFAGGSWMDTLLRHQHECPSSVRRFRGDLPQGLADVVTRMMAKRPVDRYQSPRVVAEALGPWCSAGEPTRQGAARVGWPAGLVRGVGRMLRAVFGR